MENQHRRIKGYRELQPHEVELMNEIKAKGEELAGLVEKVRGRVDIHQMAAQASGAEVERIRHAEPLRWVAIAKTDFQTGLMALTRAIAQPTTF